MFRIFNAFPCFSCISTVYYAKIGGFLCYIAPVLIVLFNEKMMDLVLPVFNSAVLLRGLDLFDIYGKKGRFNKYGSFTFLFNLIIFRFHDPSI